MIEDKILMLFEVLELFSKGQLNPDGIRERCQLPVKRSSRHAVS